MSQTDAELRKQLSTLIRDWDTAVEYMLHDPHTELEDKLMQLIKARDAAKEREILTSIEELYCNDENILLDYLRHRIAELRRESDQAKEEL